MNIDKITENLFETSMPARASLVENLEKILENKIGYINTGLENTCFLLDVENAVVTSLQDFKPGEEITMNSSSTDYTYTKVGSKGRVALQQSNTIIVDFYYQTGKSPPEQSGRWDVDKHKAYKTKFYDLLAQSGNYEEAAKKIMAEATGNIDLIELCPSVIEKLVDNDKVCLVNDNTLLEELKQNSIYSKTLHLEGARKYLRGTGNVRIISDRAKYFLQGKNIEKILQETDYSEYNSAKLAQVECSQALAELSIMEEAKKAGANYVLINQKHILSSVGDTIISVIEGTPLMIIGKQEIENLLNKPNLEEDIIATIKNFVPPKMIKSNYVGFAKLYPEEFITFFSHIKSDEQKKLIIGLLMKIDYDNKEVISWLDENESKLIREVGLKPD